MADTGVGFKIDIKGFITRACKACGGASHPDGTVNRCSCDNPPPVEVVPVTATGHF